MTPRSFTLVGAGLAGALLATLLARRGHQVDLFERRPDPRREGYQGGRSINLALAERGLHALRQADLAEPVLAQAVMMRGRMIHGLDGSLELQPYGRDDSEVIRSIHRGRLNLILLDAAERAGAQLQFGQALDHVDWWSNTLHLDDGSGVHRGHEFDHVIGADGAGSALRAALGKLGNLGESIEALGHGYKELEIPPADGGGFRIEPHALHIWPRGDYMCIALPNAEGTFTVTLFMANEGPHPSFDSVRSGAQARDLFAQQFGDALALIPTLVEDYDRHPVGQLATLRLDRWHIDGRALLLGDAAHAMVPFHGQGMNCAFEDCVALDAALDAHDEVPEAFAAFEAERRPNALAIQQMALENYLEMRDRVDDADYRLQRQLERLLAERHPGRFVPRYSMVTFMRLPYATALQRGELQRALLQQATQGRQQIDQVDIEQLDREIRERLSPPPDL